MPVPAVLLAPPGLVVGDGVVMDETSDEFMAEWDEWLAEVGGGLG